MHIKHPKDVPLEVIALFEKASFEPVRFPSEGKFYESKQQAFGARMYLARIKSQMLRSNELTKPLRAILQSIQFKQPTEETGGWSFAAAPSGNNTLDEVKTIMGNVGSPEEFWQHFD